MKAMKRITYLVGAASLVMTFVAAMSATAQEAKRPDLAALFDKREVMIPVRDGVKLHTEIYTP